jgi:hypothetical protein
VLFYYMLAADQRANLWYLYNPCTIIAPNPLLYLKRLVTGLRVNRVH